MPVKKLSVSFDAELADAVRTAAATSAGGVSGWLAEAAGARLRADAFDEFIEDWQRVHGYFTEEELAEADAELGYPAWEQSPS